MKATSGEGDERRERSVAKKLDEPSESFSDWLATVVERKRAELLQKTRNRKGGDD